MPRHSPCALISLTYSVFTNLEKSNNWFSSYKELCRLIKKLIFLLLSKNCNIFTHYKKVFFLYCCLLIIAFIITMFSFQGAFESFKDSVKPQLSLKLQSIFKKWWRLAGSNRWPPACKAGALPAELNPHILFLKWWAKMDSNHRPHDYQSCALASWAIGPYQLHFFLRYIFSCTL